MQIHGLQNAHAAHSLAGASRSAAAPRTSSAAQAPTVSPSDELDLSAEAQSLSQTQASSETGVGGGIRWEKVNALRQSIAEGNYDSPEHMSAAVDKFLDAFA